MNGFLPDAVETNDISCSGYCTACECDHSLPFGNALNYAQQVMAEFEAKQRLDYLAPDIDANPNFHFDRVLPGNRGHMFGVLECVDKKTNDTVWLRAFSSLNSGVRHIEGWAPYLITENQFNSLILPGQLEIKELTKQLNQLPENSDQRQKLEQQRANISRNLMPKIHDLYQIQNFRQEIRSLHPFFSVGKIPGGVGDCCAPKLINAAIKQGLQPVSIAEFFWGGSNSSGNKQPGYFYQSCADKCQPILGFMLCGAI